MDKQTLDYMKVRVDKGISILSRIEALNASINTALHPSVERIRIVGNRDIVLEVSKGKEDFQTRTAIAMSLFYVDAAQTEIERLKQELAEL